MTPRPEHPDNSEDRGGRRRIAGVVVLYHPGEELLENIASYAGQLDVLFAIDNSEGDTPIPALNLRESGNVIHVANGRNLGVAAALNRGARLALEHGCDYLLTMDQDSSAAPGMVAELLACLDGPAASPIGIVAPCLVTKPGQEQSSVTCCEEVPVAMTSGNLLNLAAFRSVGPFMEELFVDFVDIEYCLRLRKKGFRIVRANRALLRHSVGRLLKFRLFSRDLYLTSHSPLRKYYKTRNRFFVADIYRDSFPAFCRADRARFLLELVRLLFFEDGKKEKLAMIRKGYADYRTGRMGRYDAEEGGSSR